MKKILITGLLIFSIKVANAQTGVPDTLAYLNTIVANKAFFIGKPFSVLADSLKLKIGIKYFSPYAYFHHNATWETSTSLNFYFPQNTNEIYLTYPELKISWKPYLNMIQSDSLFTQYSGGWVPAIAAHYAPGIIADIEIRE